PRLFLWNRCGALCDKNEWNLKSRFVLRCDSQHSRLELGCNAEQGQESGAATRSGETRTFASAEKTCCGVEVAVRQSADGSGRTREFAAFGGTWGREPAAHQPEIQERGIHRTRSGGCAEYRDNHGLLLPGRRSPLPGGARESANLDGSAHDTMKQVT